MKLKLLAATLLFAASMFAWADDTAEPAKAAPVAKTYAALSLISDALEVVNSRGETGSNLTGSVNSIALPNPVYDTVVLLAIKDAFEKKGTEKPVVLLRSSEKLYSLQKEMLDGTKFKGVAGLDAALSGAKITHLLLVSKIRETAHLKLATSTVGTGKLQGLGYYLDSQYHVQDTNTFERGLGFIAPYAYFKVSLVDLATSTVTKEVQVTSGFVASSSTATASGDPWNALTPEQKDKLLKELVQKEITKAMSTLL